MELVKRLGSEGRRAAISAFALFIATAGLISTAAPVAAASHAVPWRFITVTQTSSISGNGGAAYIKDFYLQCPAGYIPVSGGVVGPTTAEVEHLARMGEWPDYTDGTYHLLLINEGFNGTTVNLAANCVWLADVGAITTVYGHFARNASGRAGGFVSCFNGQMVLSAGVDWDAYSLGRTINFSTPTTGGSQYGTGWYAAGYSDLGGAVLGVELRCVDASLLSAEYTEAADSAAGFGYVAPKAICKTGYRILTGGAAPPADQVNPGVDQGWATSGPLDYRQYPAFGEVESGVTLRSLALCVPSSTVSLQYTQTPATPSTASTGTITFSALDSVGETVVLSCTLDGVPKSCSSGSPVGFGPLVDGSHTFQAYVSNQYGSSAFAPFIWMIDTTAPLISSHSPTSSLPLAGPMTITFSEPVIGITGSSVTVHAMTANVDVAGTVQHPTSTTATWTPSASLTAGETYQFSFTSAIHDVAGNPLTPTFFTVATAAAPVVPVITSHSPTSNASLTGPLTITFSEPVDGVSASSLTVHAMAANVDVSGTIARPSTTTATWTPSARLVPGETYRFSFTTAIHDTDGNPLAATSFSVRTATSVENTSAAVLEYWDLDHTSLASGGAYISSNLSGSRADLAFTATAGQTVSVYGIRLSSGGYADVYLDGVRKATASFYAATSARARVYLSPALTAGAHTISIRPLGTKPSASTGTWVGIDSIAYGATVAQESSMSQFFRRSSSTSASGGSYDAMLHKTDSDTTSPRYEVALVGSGVSIYATKTASSGYAKVYVDGVLKATINLYAASTTYKVRVYSGTFALGQHVVKIVAVGTSTGSKSMVNLDRLAIS